MHGIPFDPALRTRRVDPRNDPTIWEPYGFHWLKLSYTAPSEIPEERVLMGLYASGGFRQSSVESLEKMGYEVLELEFEADRGFLGLATTEDGKKRYIGWAKVRKAPQPFVVDMSEARKASLSQKYQIGARTSARSYSA